MYSLADGNSHESKGLCRNVSKTTNSALKSNIQVHRNLRECGLITFPVKIVEYIVSIKLFFKNQLKARHTQ